MFPYSNAHEIQIRYAESRRRFTQKTTEVFGDGIEKPVAAVDVFARCRSFPENRQEIVLSEGLILGLYKANSIRVRRPPRETAKSCDDSPVSAARFCACRAQVRGGRPGGARQPPY